MNRPRPAPMSLDLEGVSRSWPGRDAVFSDLSLAARPSEITVLLGPSGCGKSTLLRCAASLDTPETGRILVNGNPVTEPAPDRQLILQGDNQLLPWLTVLDNVAFPIRSRMNNRIPEPAELLSLVGLPDAASLYPAQLSGGMRQRVVLARALAANPGILLLDEPFAALDNAIRTHLQILLRKIHRTEGITMLLVTHDISEALVLADTLIFMNSAGVTGSPEANPLGNDRDVDHPGFFRGHECHEAALRGVTRSCRSAISNPHAP